jgi:GT2 family glycosyltransferase/SAM-dependent methyltransferase
MLEWTGERYLPFIDPSISGAEIHYEHLHRYAFSSQFIKWKKVLDLACGEGYGSFLLSKTARCVMGIDINPETIQHALNKYSKNNLEFKEGSILNVPVSGSKIFDVIVCFEAIEHVKEHVILMSEITRLLKENGLLIISTPNKKIYSDEPNYHNPFHEKEVYFEEFEEILKNNFSNVYFFGQRTMTGSNIFPLASKKLQNCTEFVIDKINEEFSFENIDKNIPIYYIALASNVKLNDSSIAKSFLIDASNTQISLLSNQVANLNHTIAAKDLQLQETSSQVANLNQTLASKDEYLTVLTTQVHSLEHALTDKARQIQELTAKMQSLEHALTDKARQIQELTAKMQSLEDAISRKEESIEEETAHLHELEQVISAKDSQLMEKTRQVLSLEKKILVIETSIVWQLTTKFHQKIIERVLPKNTRRRNLYDLGLKSGRILINDGLKKLHWHYNERKRVKKIERELNRNENDSKIQPATKDLTNSSINQIKFPKSPNEVEVSIIIPVYNKFQYTVNCLHSISQKTNGAYEVIVVDDASTDETAIQLKNLANITTIKNNDNLGFVESCNRGAKSSHGKYLLFLNNDTRVTENWLPPLLNLINKDDVGAVGAKLIYPNGLLQEAGSIIWADASGWNYGREDNPKKSQYNFVRDVDYCSGAALIVKKDIFEKLNGFDTRFKPGYYEDTDLCFSIRNLGYRVLYQPLSVVIHYEGISHGTDVSTGIKRFQEINKIKFFEKWKNILLDRHYESSIDNLFDARIRRKDKKILVIDHYVPTWDRDAGSYRMYNLLKLLVELNHKVTFIGDNLFTFEPYTTDLQQNGIEVIYHPTVQSIDEYLKDYGSFFDIVILSRSHIAFKHYHSVKKNCTHAKIIFDTVDLQYLRERRRAEIENDAMVLKEAEKLRLTELFLARQCDLTLVVSPIEKELLFQEDPLLRIEVLSTIHEVKPSNKQFCDRKDLLFVGGFDHLPNIDAMRWFVKEIFPLIVRSISDIKLCIIGSNPTKEIEDLASSNIIVVGYAKDLTPYFNNCRVFVAPLRYGAGVKGKINQSMSYGVPVVTTPIGAEGITLTDGLDILIAESPDSFAQKVITVYKDETLWNSLSKNSIMNVQKYFSFDVTKQQIQKIIELM